MTIISGKHASGIGSDFVFCVVNDDQARRTISALKKADTLKLFTFEQFAADTIVDVLTFVKNENKAGRS